MSALVDELRAKAKNLEVRYPEQSALWRAAEALTTLQSRLEAVKAERDAQKAGWENTYALARKLEYELHEANEFREAAEARVEELQNALATIREDDAQDSHPCGPQQYGHFGSIANAALSPARTEEEKQ